MPSNSDTQDDFYLSPLVCLSVCCHVKCIVNGLISINAKRVCSLKLHNAGRQCCVWVGLYCTSHVLLLVVVLLFGTLIFFHLHAVECSLDVLRARVMLTVACTGSGGNGVKILYMTSSVHVFIVALQMQVKE